MCLVLSFQFVFISFFQRGISESKLSKIGDRRIELLGLFYLHAWPLEQRAIREGSYRGRLIEKKRTEWEAKMKKLEAVRKARVPVSFGSPAPSNSASNAVAVESRVSVDAVEPR